MRASESRFRAIVKIFTSASSLAPCALLIMFGSTLYLFILVRVAPGHSVFPFLPLTVVHDAPLGYGHTLKLLRTIWWFDVRANIFYPKCYRPAVSFRTLTWPVLIDCWTLNVVLKLLGSSQTLITNLGRYRPVEAHFLARFHRDFLPNYQ